MGSLVIRDSKLNIFWVVGKTIHLRKSSLGLGNIDQYFSQFSDVLWASKINQLIKKIIDSLIDYENGC